MTAERLIRSDIIMGAKAIAKELGTTRQRVYRLAAQGRMPFFNMGGAVCARRSQLEEWMKEQEGKSWRRK